MPPVGADRPQPCRATTPVARPATRGSSIPPTVEEIIAVMRRAPDDRHGARLRALIVVLWRAGLRVQEALPIGERDLDSRRGSPRRRTSERRTRLPLVLIVRVGRRRQRSRSSRGAAAPVTAWDRGPRIEA